MRPSWWTVLLCVWLGAGCAYRLGPTNGEVAGARSVRVDLFNNETLEPRLTEAVGTALRRTLQQDGTYRLNTRGDADIVLKGTITEYLRSGISFEPRDIITPRDFQITMVAKITATERASGRVILDRQVQGRTTIRIGPDLSSAERQAVPSLAEDLARNVTSLLVDGSW
ncbi:MAG: LptE family protein [Verrucomicrobiota bacterium]